jgi:hypothetical protein
LFEFGDKFKRKYDESVGVAKGYYTSVSGYKDELLWAAIWLYKATEKDEYLNYVLENAYDFGGTTWAMTEFSWDVKYSGVQAIASMVNSSFSHFLIKRYIEMNSLQSLFDFRLISVIYFYI